MNAEERDKKLQELIIEYHETRAIRAACEACDLLYDVLTEGVKHEE